MNCPYCLSGSGSGSYYPSTVFNQKKFDYLKCSNCGTIYLSPFPTEDDYLKMYPPTYQQGADKTILSDPGLKLPGLRFSYQHHFNLIRKYSNGDNVLDYGCGNGNFLANANAQGIPCDGAEFNPLQVEVLKANFPDRNIYEISKFIADPALKYDVIRLSNVLEHLDKPHEIINQLLLKLTDKGILLIEGPMEINFSIAFVFRSSYFKIRKALQPGWTVTHTPTHITFTSLKGQTGFFRKFPMKELHFEVTECAWPYPESFVAAKGLGGKIKAVIARLSILTAKMNSSWGNTFIFAGRKI